MSTEFVRRLHSRYESTQEIAPRPPIPRVVPFYRKHKAAIRAAVAEHSGLTLEQLRTKLGLEVSIGTLWGALQKLRITLKKTLHAAEQKRPDVVVQRAEFDFFQLAGIDPRRLVFLDETRSNGLFSPVVIDGALNGEILRESVEQHLAPQLRSGDIVLMDNLPSHKVAGVAEAI